MEVTGGWFGKLNLNQIGRNSVTLLKFKPPVIKKNWMVSQKYFYQIVLFLINNETFVIVMQNRLHSAEKADIADKSM